MINGNHIFALTHEPVNYHPESNGYDLSYSDGVKAMMEQYKANWIINFVAHYKPNKFNRGMFHEVYIERVQYKTFTIAMINCNGGYYRITRVVKAILPCDCMTLWLVNSLLMFPSEYRRTT